MTAFVPMATRFSVADRAAAKVAKPAKTGFFPSVPTQADPDEAAKVAKVGQPWPVELSQLSQPGASGLSRESLDRPALSQLSPVSQPGTSKPETVASAAPSADGWLRDIAVSIGKAMHAGAEREAEPEGWLLLIRPDGSRMVATPRIVAELAAAGLLPDMAAGVARSHFAARARPACWSDPNDRPVEGDRCTCGGRRWWGVRKAPDGWCCVTCRPPLHLTADAVCEVQT